MTRGENLRMLRKLVFWLVLVPLAIIIADVCGGEPREW